MFSFRFLTNGGEVIIELSRFFFQMLFARIFETFVIKQQIISRKHNVSEGFEIMPFEQLPENNEKKNYNSNTHTCLV